MISEENEKLQVKQISLDIPRTSQESLNLADLPLFLQSKKTSKSNTIRLVRYLRDRNGNHVYDKDGNRVTQIWTVSGSEEYGLPLACDQRTYIMCIYLLLKRGDIETGKFYFSLYELLKLIGRTNSGQDYLWLNKSLNRLYTASIFTENIIYDRVKEEYIRVKRFRIFDDLETIGSRSGSPVNVPLSYGKFNEVILNDIKCNYLLTIDIDFFRGLEHHISESLYRILNKRKYNRTSFSVGIYSLAELLALNVNYAPSQLKRILDKAHKELIAKGFLKSSNYRKTSKEQVWKVTYTFPRKQLSVGVMQYPLPEEESQSMVEELIKRGITAASAKALVEKHPNQVNRKMEVFDWLVKTDSSLIEKNPAGYLRKSIEENWQPPSGFVSKTDREKKAQEKEKASLLEDLETLTLEESQTSEILEARKDDMTKEEIQKEIAQIRAERERARKEEKAKIRELLSSMTQEELKALKKEVLSKVDNFHKRQSNYRKVGRKDIRNLEGRGLTESYIRDIRDRIIKERYLKDNS